MFDRPLEPRERRTIALGAGVSAVALLFAFVVLPTVRRWQGQEAAIAVARDHVARLRSLVAYNDRLQALAASQESRAAALPVRLVRARTAALASSELQGLLQDIARSARVSITRLDVATGADSTDLAAGAIPATVSAVGDIYGLADLLARLQTAPRLLDVRELNISSNSALRGELLQIALVIRAPFLLEP